MSKFQTIRLLGLDTRYWFGDNFHSLDLRLSREFVFAERWRLSLIGEVFNVHNAANLSGHSGNLNGVTFGQPSARFTQVFGSGGPRAFQLGAGQFLSCGGSLFHRELPSEVEIISHCVWLYFRFPLSFRDIEEIHLPQSPSLLLPELS